MQCTVLIKPSGLTTVNNNRYLVIGTSICYMECHISSLFNGETVVLISTTLLMIFLKQNKTTNAKILHYAMNNNHYLCQSTESTYEINSYITRTKIILQTLADSASGTVHTRTDQIMDKRAAGDCLGNLHTSRTNSTWIITADVLYDSSFLVAKYLTHYIYSLLSLHV